MLSQTTIRVIARALAEHALTHADAERMEFWLAVEKSDPSTLPDALRGIRIEPSCWPKVQQSFGSEAMEAFCPPIVAGGGGVKIAMLDLRGELLEAAPLLARLDGASRIVMAVDCPGGDAGVAAEVLVGMEGAGVPTQVHIRRAGSAAALVACCSPGRRTIEPDGEVTLHPVASACLGSPRDLRRTADRLEAITERWVDRLAARTGQPREICAAWLSGPDITFDAQAAVEHGLVDGILPSSGAPPV